MVLHVMAASAAIVVSGVFIVLIMIYADYLEEISVTSHLPKNVPRRGYCEGDHAGPILS
jgi:hypothetical protein